MDARDRYILTLAMLEGDREARKILADLLEEQGERGLAQWTREGRTSEQRQLELAIMLLPCLTAIRLGTEMVATCGGAGAATVGNELGVTFVRAWLQGERQRTQVLEFLRLPVKLALEWSPWQNMFVGDACAEAVWQHLRDAMARLMFRVEHQDNLSYYEQAVEYESQLYMRRIIVRTRNRPPYAFGLSSLFKAELHKLIKA